MKVLIDTCVAIDFLQKRGPFSEAAYEIFRMSAADEIAGYITAKSATDIYYLIHRFTHSDEASRTSLMRSAFPGKMQPGNIKCCFNRFNAL